MIWDEPLIVPLGSDVRYELVAAVNEFTSVCIDAVNILRADISVN